MSGEIEGKEFGRLMAEVEQVKREVEQLRVDVRELTEMAHRWRGAFALVLGVGGFLGWVASWIPRK